MEEEQLDQELFEHHRLEVSEGQEVLRIDKFLMNRLENTSRNRIQNAATAGSILVNGKAVKSNYKVKAGDVISIVLTYPPRDKDIKPEPMDLDILHEDDHVIVLNKPAGLVVHPGYNNFTGTLVNGLVHHFSDLPVLNEDMPRPGLVHRLDKDTSGIMVIAKNELAMTKLAKQFYDRTIDRKYEALVWGDFENDEGTVTGNLGRSLKDRKIMAVFPEGDTGKHAVTHFQVLERFRYVTLVECRLETGRTHQIRVHMQYTGHPVFNDDRYGGDRILKGTTFTKYRQFIDNCFRILSRQALHARSLGFDHPATGQRMHFEAGLPEDMSAVIEKWRKYTSSDKGKTAPDNYRDGK